MQGRTRAFGKGPPSLATLYPPLKTPFLKNINTFFNFFLPYPPTWTCFVHHKNTPKRLHFWVVTLTL